MKRIAMTAALALLTAAPGSAGDAGPQPDAEQLSQDMIKNVDSWIGDIARKLDSDKPVTSSDFDSMFGAGFFSGSQDPIGDLEKVQQRVNARLGDKRARFDAPYGKWLGGKMSAADLNPEVTRDDEHVTVSLNEPREAEEAMRVNITGGLIKMSYTRRETRETRAADGSVTASSFTRTMRRAMAVPKGANPAKYRVSAAKGKVSIIFDRLRKNSAEATK